MLGRPHLNDRMWVRLINAESNKVISEDIEVNSDNLHIDEWTWYMPGVEGAMDT